MLHLQSTLLGAHVHGGYDLLDLDPLDERLQLRVGAVLRVRYAKQDNRSIRGHGDGPHVGFRRGTRALLLLCGRRVHRLFVVVVRCGTIIRAAPVKRPAGRSEGEDARVAGLECFQVIHQCLRTVSPFRFVATPRPHALSIHTGICKSPMRTTCKHVF